MPTTPKLRQYPAGYQAALRDILTAAIARADDPADGMLTWISDNLLTTEPDGRQPADWQEYVDRIRTWLMFDAPREEAGR